MSKCRIPDCDDEVVYIHLEVCSACYSGLAYWRGRSRHDKEKRQEKIKRLNSRMSFMIDNPRVHPKRKGD